MRRLVIVAALSAALFGCKKKDEKQAEPPKPAAEVKPEPPKAPEPPSVDPALLERGRYLVDLMGCPQCHTAMGPQGPNLDMAWAGGLEVPETFGTWRSPNITQDKDTGIGAWTDEQIIASIREGKRPDGDGLYPIMPYMFYNALSNDDAKALVAVLRTIPAKANKVERATDLKLPKIPVPPATGAEPKKDDPVAYGAYLASVMHCAMCHTPFDEKSGGFDMSKAYAGGFKFEIPFLGEGALYSANLTPDPKTGIGAWKDEQLVDAIRAMKKKDGSLIQGPMAMYQQGWYRVEDADAKAIVAFLRSLAPIVNKVPASTFKPKGPPPGAPAAPADGAAPASKGVMPNDGTPPTPGTR